MIIPILLAVVSPASEPVVTHPYPAITRSEEVRTHPPVQLHAITIDLSDKDVSIHVSQGGADPDGPGPWNTVLTRVETMAERDGLTVAVNGNYFGSKDSYQLLGQTMKYPLGSWARVMGPAMTDGNLWSAGPLPASLAVVNDRGHVSIGQFKQIPGDARQIVCGELILSAGKNVARVLPPNHKGHDDIAPRTAVGVNADSSRLYLLVVDGRRDETSIGLSVHELSDEMSRLGATDALNLDGGGSSTLVMRDPDTGKIELLNRPSDGSTLILPISLERPVACALGVRLAHRADADHKN